MDILIIIVIIQIQMIKELHYLIKLITHHLNTSKKDKHPTVINLIDHLLRI